jgi:hypothetical protein
MLTVATYIIFLIFLIAVTLTFLIRLRNMQFWIATYVKNAFTKKTKHPVKHVYFCLADHYEPYYGDASQADARKLVDDWVAKYPEIAKQHFDSDGNPPQHSYFYPIEEYDKYILDQLSQICKSGYGDVDVHLHHDNDTAENLRVVLTDFKQTLFDDHQLLRKNQLGEIVYGFIHGNWALDNSRPDGRWCGIDNELDILAETGCAYDMTMPSAPSDTQTKIINSIYYAKEDGCSKSHDYGRNLVHGLTSQEENELLMIQGPLTLNWKNRKLGLIPKIESGELSGDLPPNISRVKLWVDCAVSVEGKDEHVFVKVHTHGLQKENSKMFFDRSGFDDLWSSLESLYRDTDGCQLHYVSAWEMYEKIKQLENL